MAGGDQRKNTILLKCAKCGWSDRIPTASIGVRLDFGSPTPLLGGEEDGQAGKIGPCGEHKWVPPQFR